MNTARIQELIKKFNEDVLDSVEQNELERFIESGEIDLTALHDITRLEDRIVSMEFPSPSEDLDHEFYKMLSREKKATSQGFSWRHFFTWPVLVPALAVASVALLIGIGIGVFIHSPQQSTEIKVLTAEVSDLKEMMMITMLAEESATERLKAVSLTQEMDDVSNKVTNALLQTLNTDENVNVRLAALEALLPYATVDHVREELVRSISKQNSPLVQIALAELMVVIQEKSSVKALEKVLHNTKTPNGVKKKIRESIEVLT